MTVHVRRINRLGIAGDWGFPIIRHLTNAALNAPRCLDVTKPTMLYPQAANGLTGLRMRGMWDVSQPFFEGRCGGKAWGDEVDLDDLPEPRDGGTRCRSTRSQVSWMRSASTPRTRGSRLLSPQN